MATRSQALQAAASIPSRRRRQRRRHCAECHRDGAPTSRRAAARPRALQTQRCGRRRRRPHVGTAPATEAHSRQYPLGLPPPPPPPCPRLARERQQAPRAAEAAPTPRCGRRAPTHPQVRPSGWCARR
eukprot:85250-Chlamydomonas_euryale.AAC.2